MKPASCKDRRRILVIEELQLEGKKRMKIADFLRGYSIEPGTRLGE